MKKELTYMELVEAKHQIEDMKKEVADFGRSL
jgi:hypothetical protein